MVQVTLEVNGKRVSHEAPARMHLRGIGMPVLRDGIVVGGPVVLSPKAAV